MNRARSVVFVLVGVAVLVLERGYVGPLQDMVRDHGGNVAASFAVYFIMTLQPFTSRYRRLVAAGLALIVVELFEATDGFAVMGNVYDRADFVANLIGVGLAVATDTVVSGIVRRRSDGSGSGSPAKTE